jgi:alpha-ketoglutarate-dependent taurine dioxygenase
MTRRALQLSHLTTEGLFDSGAEMPWLIQPATERVDLVEWIKAHREALENRLLEAGAILFRGFTLDGLADFRRVVDAASTGLVPYTFRASPRHEVSERVYTSTEYPADQRIFPHNEHAFSPVFPRKLFFYCETPATSGGETPIGNGRRIRDDIPVWIRDRFREKGVRYIRNYSAHLGLTWQTVFQTEDRVRVEAYCRDNGLEWRWKSDGSLYTQQTGPAWIRHPRTGEELWFNHATFFHVTTLSREVRDALLASFAEQDLPNHTYYGDGSPIESDVLDLLREAYQRNMNRFAWRSGDVLMLDNLLAMHARESYEGARRILVGMAEPVRLAEAGIEPLGLRRQALCKKP